MIRVCVIRWLLQCNVAWDVAGPTPWGDTKSVLQALGTAFAWSTLRAVAKATIPSTTCEIRKAVQGFGVTEENKAGELRVPE
ncbi:hypothetical protein chiPu_0027361 [Chiloscyllium punctatum]|uniref:Uncharacterized protein n=1 Tax=Chiloscyllium punctatum TaxID=137246 RepID=A0A401TLG9_CHIPU|nr:hypothetical protein [Chiloscyllium punctatum]